MEVRDEVMASESVTSVTMERIRALGNSDASLLMGSCEVRSVDSRSQSARPVAPCSRRARAVERARVPAPPVTVKGAC